MPDPLSTMAAGDDDIDERALVFSVGQAPVVGVLALPARRAAGAGVVIVVGGPQYRAGSHRQFVSLARALAGSGCAVLRFDYRGMGDSGGALRDFEQIDDDLRAAVDALVGAQPQIAHVALWGLCDGASAALMYAPQDPRVTALILANPWARGSDTQARTRIVHYYARRLFSADLWRRALSGRVRLRESVGGLSGSVRQAVAPAASGGFRQRMVDGLTAFRGPVLWLMSGADLTAREFETFMAADRRRASLMTEKRCSRHDLPDTDHTFSGLAAEAAVAAATGAWLHRLGPPPAT